MGAIPSIPGRIGFNSHQLCEETGTNHFVYGSMWNNLSWEEAWERKAVVGEEGNERLKMGQTMIDGVRMQDCKEQTGKYLREYLFEPYKNKTGEAPYTAAFTTDEFSRCWFPWSKPKKLYTTEPEYMDFVINLAKEEFGIDSQQLSIMSQKYNNKGEFWMGIDIVNQN
eukprot:TRINITY_DN31527_c0_g1_i1.p1 TRINITY_DN31527_c0_g1~~TRINITY_DN31527_c0_g1_i1.p1  ORF type:complete len:186 (+),score=29.27 TRINITY_DN31527_c0_g1_i1:56-559(+)